MQFTKEQIDKYKKKYGRIWEFKCRDNPDKSCILRAAGRNDLSLANISAISRNEDGPVNFDANKFNESILLSCWVDGDEEIKTSDKYFLGVTDQLRVIIEKAEFEVKEL